MTGSRYRYVLLIVLLIIAAFNFLDRAALGIALQSIKVDLKLTDTQLGLISGFAFAVFYSIMGIPIARLADRYNRVTIISITTAVWSVMVALCGAASSFATLALIRVGVGVGEAGCIPPAYSLIADYFERAERPRATAIYTLAGPISFLVGYYCSGWLNDALGWRKMFFVLGLPGLILVPLALLTLKEPRKMLQPSPIKLGKASEHQSFAAVSAVLWRNRTFKHILIANSVIYFFGYGLLQWQPTFFIRQFGLTAGEVGTWFALIYGLGGLLGTYLSGVFASRLAAGDEKRQLRAASIAILVHAAFLSAVYLSPTRNLALGLLAIANISGYAVYAPMLATVQSIVPDRMRATSIAIIYLFGNLIGMGLGPLAAGALSDLLRSTAGSASLRDALLLLTPGFLIATWQLWRAGSSAQTDIVAAGEDARHSGEIPQVAK
jgi:MFS family permease